MLLSQKIKENGEKVSGKNEAEGFEAEIYKHNNFFSIKKLYF